MAETKKESNRIIQARIEGHVLTINVKGIEQSIVMNAVELDSAIREQALMHGLKQKIADAAAIPRNLDNGMSATNRQKYDAMVSVAMRLREGLWNAEGTGDGTGGNGLLFRALVRFYAGKQSAEKIREFLQSKSKAEQAALRKNPRIAAIIEDIRAEDAQNGEEIDTEALLGELNDDALM